jgi:hypothetical protein
MACGGRYITVTRAESDGSGVHAELHCRFCTYGGMTLEQLDAWRAWRRKEIDRQKKGGQR